MSDEFGPVKSSEAPKTLHLKTTGQNCVLWPSSQQGRPGDYVS